MSDQFVHMSKQQVISSDILSDQRLKLNASTAGPVLPGQLRQNTIFLTPYSCDLNPNDALFQVCTSPRTILSVVFHMMLKIEYVFQ